MCWQNSAFLQLKGTAPSVQLIFSLARYEAVINAYLEGLEAVKNEDLSKISSVASFFVSRVDVLVDKRLEKIGSEEALGLRGKVGCALKFRYLVDSQAFGLPFPMPVCTISNSRSQSLASFIFNLLKYYLQVPSP